MNGNESRSANRLRAIVRLGGLLVVVVALLQVLLLLALYRLVGLEEIDTNPPPMAAVA